MSDYMRYINRTSKIAPFYENHVKSYIVPFCIPHVTLLNGNKLLHQKFDKFYKFPTSAHKFYWNLHSEVLKQLNGY